MPPCLSAAYLLFLSAIFLETLWWGQDSSLKAISSRFKPAICTFVSCALLAWLIFKKAHARKMFQQIASEDWQVCPDCRYSLRGHADGRSSPLSNISLLRCPECSYLFTPESLLRDWADTVTLVNNMVRGTYPDPPHFST
ncbi:MAG: hypothetical protein JXQ73_23205 [Phycisphaerae bacterium]|nr:hypothetical protein [Phycisphaerae bacterium]